MILRMFAATLSTGASILARKRWSAQLRAHQLWLKMVREGIFTGDREDGRDMWTAVYNHPEATSLPREPRPVQPQSFQE